MTGHIDRLTLSHVHLLAALHKACFDDPSEPVWDEAAMQDILSMAGAFGFVYTEDETPKGFTLCCCAVDECEILSIGVLPDSRGKGIASELLQAARQTADRLAAHSIFLEVAADNNRARDFYKWHNFKDIGVRRNYYKRGQKRIDAILMSSEITNK